MSTKYYGNYLGICISRMDPEKRGRVKIWIPEVYPALFDKVNEEGKDVMFRCVGDNVQNSLKAEFREKLERILPYAEAAGPVFGSSAPGFFDNASGKYVQTGNPGQQSMTGNPDPNAISPSSSPLASTNAGLKGPNSMNGRLDINNRQQLVPLGDYVDAHDVGVSARYLNPYVEGKFRELCLAYQAEKGKKMVISDCYRSYAGQVECARTKGLTSEIFGPTGKKGKCAKPGNSNHGLGTAVDVGGNNQREQEVWMFQNASKFGFSTITRSGPGSPEAWHWEIPPSKCPAEAFAYTTANTTADKNTNASTGEAKPK